jgi:hypothetical protein
MKRPSLDLSAVIVRPIEEATERVRWQEEMRRYHPQGFQGMVGEQISYVAVDERGCWLACLGWCAASRHLESRDNWIGWTPTQRLQRRHLVANNARFLILPGKEGIANLASRILGLNSKRLSTDWQERYGHPILLAETFVEEDRLGSCYRACGWTEVGKTKGFRRTQQDGYRKHGISKRCFVRPLGKGAQRRLSRRKPLPEDRPLDCVSPHVQPIAGDQMQETPSLFALIESEVEDVRKSGGQRYRLGTILGILILGILAGETTCTGIARWAQTLSDKHRRELGCIMRAGGKRPVPTKNTYRYVLQDLEPSKLEHLIRRWCEITGININTTTIAIDGKVLRGSATDQEPARAQLNIYDTHRDIPLGQIAIPDKTTEVTAIRELIEHHDIKDRIITVDAAHTNRTTMMDIVEKGGSRYASLKATRLAFSTALSKHSHQQD